MRDDAVDALQKVTLDRGGAVQLTMGRELALGHCYRERFLVLEVLVDRARRAADSLGDLLDGRGEIALGVELEQGIDDRLAGAEAPRDPSVLSLRRHGCRR